MRLELGSGYRPAEGFEHNDIRAGHHIEYVWPAEDILDHIEHGSVAELRATHLLEHYPWAKTHDVLKAWCAALKSGGTLYLEVPHFVGAFNANRRGEIDDAELCRLVYADQDYPENFHYAGFTPALLTGALTRAGFVGVDVRDIGLVLVANATRP